jgi:hypothetical protein
MRDNEPELSNDSAPADGADAPDPETAAVIGEQPGGDDDSDAFLANLARVMQTAAGAERLRITEDSERRRSAHLELIRARETSEADQMRALADGDVKAIDTWADAEIERIQSERERRISSRRAELADRLDEHRQLIGREVEAVEAAIAAYRTEVEVYFSRLDAETDPVAIAREAGRRPQFPVLGSTGLGDAPASTSTEPAGEAGAGNDGTQPPGGDAPEAIADADSAPSPGPEAGVASPEEPAEPAETKSQSAEAAAAANPVAPRSSAALMSSWFRRGDDGRSDTDS